MKALNKRALIWITAFLLLFSSKWVFHNERQTVVQVLVLAAVMAGAGYIATERVEKRRP